MPRFRGPSTGFLSSPSPAQRALGFVPFWINVTLEVALYRNSLRPDYERVPETSIRSVAAQFEPPTVSEGYIDVFCVENGDP